MLEGESLVSRNLKSSEKLWMKQSKKLPDNLEAVKISIHFSLGVFNTSSLFFNFPRLCTTSGKDETDDTTDDDIADGIWNGLV